MRVYAILSCLAIRPSLSSAEPSWAKTISDADNIPNDQLHQWNINVAPLKENYSEAYIVVCLQRPSNPNGSPVILAHVFPDFQGVDKDVFRSSHGQALGIHRRHISYICFKKYIKRPGELLSCGANYRNFCNETHTTKNKDTCTIEHTQFTHACTIVHKLIRII